jgi:hypothetical protein
VDLNLVIDARFVLAEDILAGLPHRTRDLAMVLEGDAALPETFGLNVWMTHPRKGADCAIRVRHCDRGDLAAIRAYLKKNADVHERHYSWVAEGAYEPEIAPGPSR